MSIYISKFEDQARGYYDGGSVKERKSVSFESPIKGSSTLYSLTYTWSEEGGEIEEHAHKGFEILTYVLEGKMEHQEAGTHSWIPLDKGDLQVVRAGSGFSNTERYTPNTHTLQIWLDPDFRRSLQRPSSFTDYEADDFETESFNGMQRIDFMGDESPVYLSTKVALDRYDFDAGDHSLPMEQGHFLTALVLKGKVEVDGETMSMGDVVQVSGETQFNFNSSEASSLLVLQQALEPGYRTYNDQLQVSQ